MHAASSVTQIVVQLAWLSMHVPPFMHGCDAHASGAVVLSVLVVLVLVPLVLPTAVVDNSVDVVLTTVSQLLPPYPAPQLQLYAYGSAWSLVHVAVMHTAADRYSAPPVCVLVCWHDMRHARSHCDVPNCSATDRHPLLRKQSALLTQAAIWLLQIVRQPA